MASDASVVSSLTYSYDADSRPISVTTLNGTWTYGYDPAGELNAKSIDEVMAKANARSKEGLSAEERVEAMATLAQLHGHVVGALSSIDAQDWNRKTPVRFGGGEPYPTSAADIIEWLRGHYLEHIPHVGELLQLWSAAGKPTPR